MEEGGRLDTPAPPCNTSVMKTFNLVVILVSLALGGACAKKKTSQSADSAPAAAPHHKGDGSGGGKGDGSGGGDGGGAGGKHQPEGAIVPGAEPAVHHIGNGSGGGKSDGSGKQQGGGAGGKHTIVVPK